MDPSGDRRDGAPHACLPRGREVFVERAARSRLVEALSSGGVAGDGVSECLGRRLLVAVGAEHGAASLGGRRGPWAAVPESGRLLHASQEGVSTSGVAGPSACGCGGEVVVDGTELAFGGLVEQGFGAVDQRERFGRVFRDAQERAVDDVQEVVSEG